MPAGDPVLPTVTGSIVRPDAGVRLDAHGHAWIAPPALVDDHVPALTDESRQAAALARFAEAAAPRRAALLDVQAPGCGRDAAALARLAMKSAVAIAAVTGFHLARAYPRGLRPWTTGEAASDTFVREIEGGMREAPLARAAAIKAAFTGVPEDRDPCWDGAIEACARTGALLLVHTDAGAGVEDLVVWLERRGVGADRLYLLDVDERDDPQLHLELASAGALLGFAASLREDDHPARRSRRPYALLEQLLEAGLAPSIAVGLDLSSPERWAEVNASSPPTPTGPAALVTGVEARLEALGTPPADLDLLLGGSLLDRAARPEVPFGLR